jgi:hypothetical protein
LGVFARCQAHFIELNETVAAAPFFDDKAWLALGFKSKQRLAIAADVETMLALNVCKALMG